MTKQVIAPFNPTEAQWGGLARAIVWWMRSYPSNKHTPSTLVEHLSNLGHEIPAWMGDEAELRTKDHVISKGTIAVLIYKAMLAELPEAPPVYLYRRKGQDDFVTCDHSRFEELSNNQLFETRTVFPHSSHMPYEILTGLKHVPVTYAANTGDQGASQKAGTFTKGITQESGDDGKFESGINHQHPENRSQGGMWWHRIAVYGDTGPEAEQLRDYVLEALNARKVAVSDFPAGYLVVSKSDPHMKGIYRSNPTAVNRDLFDVFELSVHRVPHWTDPHIQWDGKDWVGYDEAGLELARSTERDKVRDELVIYSHNQLGLPV